MISREVFKTGGEIMSPAAGVEPRLSVNTPQTKSGQSVNLDPRGVWNRSTESLNGALVNIQAKATTSTRLWQNRIIYTPPHYCPVFFSWKPEAQLCVA